MSNLHEPASVIETRLTHDMHRRATSLLAEAAGRPSADRVALAELRDFLVATLRHHHESEDGDLWPLITATAPGVTDHLGDLSTEHHQLDAALDALAAVPVSGESDRAALEKAAIAVRDLVHRHLEHEEPVLFPALRDHVTAEVWAEFSRKVIATSPPTGAHLMIGFFDQVGSREEVDLILSGLPAPAQEFVPVMRTQAKATLDALQAAR
jgi:hemerythrin-like domain-containing protein